MRFVLPLFPVDNCVENVEKSGYSHQIKLFPVFDPLFGVWIIFILGLHNHFYLNFFHLYYIFVK